MVLKKTAIKTSTSDDKVGYYTLVFRPFLLNILKQVRQIGMYMQSKKIDLDIVESVAQERERRFAAFIEAMTGTPTD